jgi:tetratricopeptide (TPR) repeat protein
MGDLYLRTGDANAAITAYQAHLEKSPNDPPVMRSLGLALLAAGRASEAVEWVDAAYATDPGLAGHPVGSGAFGADDEYRSTLEFAGAYANRVKTAPAWLTLAVLMQAGGRTLDASIMIGRAAASGLDAVVADRFRLALGS